MKKQILTLLGALLCQACTQIPSPPLNAQNGNAVQVTSSPTPSSVSNGYQGPIVIKIDPEMQRDTVDNTRLWILQQREPLNSTPLGKGLFDPRQSESLVAIKQLENELNSQGNSSFQVGRFRFIEPGSNNLNIPFESGILTLEFKNPKTDLPIFKRLYGGTVRNDSPIGERQFYDIQLDLNRCPVEKLEELVRKFCKKFNRDIREVIVSSWSAFRTLFMEMDMLVNHEDIIKSVSVNGMAEISWNPVPTPTPPPEPTPSPTPTATPSQ